MIFCPVINWSINQKKRKDRINTTSAISKAQTGLRTHAIFTIGALVLQFVLGMITNLYVAFPDNTQPGELWDYARSQLPTLAHIVIGTLLLVSAVVFVIRAARESNRHWLASAVTGMIAIIVAFLGGVMFTTFQADAYSLVMALGFIAAFVAYVWGLVVNQR